VEALRVERLDRGGLEADLRVLGGLQEVRRDQVRVALLVVGAQAVVPARDGCSPPWIRPSNAVKRPLTELKRSLVSVTWKPIVVWTGSTTQVPAGMTSRVMVVLVTSFPPFRLV
jgi:hypothetical protein